MKFVLIYGPPAVGKLTVANALAEQTGYKLFHNHLSVDVVSAIFERGTPPYYKLVRQIRSMLFEEAAKANLNGIIFTIVFERPRKAIIDHYVEIVERHQGQVCFVHLYCDMAILAERVQSPERYQHGKITDVGLLHQFMDQLQEPFEPIQEYDSLRIDTGKMRPEMAAHVVMNHYALPKQLL